MKCIDPLRLLALLPLLGGCASPLLEYQLEGPAAILQPVGSAPVVDGRSRFRDIFCALLAGEPDLGTCEQYLHRLGDEPAADAPDPLPAHDPGLRLMIVPGALGECFGTDALPYPRALQRLRDRGYRVDYLRVDGRSGSRHNAAQIADQLAQLPQLPEERLVLVGYSKGASDSMRFLADYPGAASRVSALVSVAGSINGSPLANRYDGLYDLLLARFPFDDCGPGDGELIESLQRDRSMSLLARQPPPPGPAYYSLGAFTDTAHTARIMRLVGNPDLSRADPRNDGQTVYYDQVIPGSTLLGYLNADHWAAAIPMDEAKPLFAGNAASDRPFPRWVVFEAVVLFVAESLGSR